MKYWLLKTEPNTYSWQDLVNEPDKTTFWEGVRNYQARNLMRDEMQEGDLAFIYHSVVKPPAIHGIARIVRAAYPDHYAHDPGHKYFDPKDDPDNPRWVMVDVQAVQAVDPPVTLDEIKKKPELQNMVLVNNSRLSVQPVQPEEWRFILSMRGISL